MLERLQKIISRAGIASRRHAEELIVSGQVKVNGVVVTELGAKADPERDHIEAAGRTADQPAAASYFILHKPPHVVSTMADPEGRATLRHVLRGMAGGVFPVGGLEYASSGLILLTSDGQLANSIFQASSGVTQVFWVKLKGRPSPETLSKVTHRAQARLRLLPAPDASAGHVENPWYEAELRGLRRDLLRQAFFDAGHPIEKMKRVRLGPLELGDLPEGQYRQLAPSEVEALRRAVERAAAHVDEQIAPPAPPIAARPFQRRKWQPRGERGTAPPARTGGGTGERTGYRPDQNRFAPAAKGGPKRSGPPGFPPRGEGDAASAGRRFPPRGDREERPGRDRFRPVAKGPSTRGGRPSFPPRGERGAPTGERRFPPRGKPDPRGKRGTEFGGERGTGPRGDRPTGPPRGDRPSGPPRGDRPFRAGGDRGSRPFGRDKFRGSRSGPPRTGDRRPGQPFHRGDGGKPRGDRKPGSGKFVPRGPRAGAPPSGKYRGKPGRPGGSGRSSGPPRPGGKPFNRPGARPPRRPSGPKNFPPREDE